MNRSFILSSLPVHAYTYRVGLFLKPVMSSWPLHFTGQVANEIILVQNWAFIEPHQKQLSLLGAVWFRAGSGSSRCADGPLDQWTIGPVHYCLSNLLCLLLYQLGWTWTWSYPHRWCSLMCPFYSVLKSPWLLQWSYEIVRVLKALRYVVVWNRPSSSDRGHT